MVLRVLAALLVLAEAGGAVAFVILGSWPAGALLAVAAVLTVTVLAVRVRARPKPAPGYVERERVGW